MYENGVELQDFKYVESNEIVYFIEQMNNNDLIQARMSIYYSYAKCMQTYLALISFSEKLDHENYNI